MGRQIKYEIFFQTRGFVLTKEDGNQGEKLLSRAQIKAENYTEGVSCDYWPYRFIETREGLCTKKRVQFAPPTWPPRRQVHTIS